MPLILGIDAAWTARQQSGVALVDGEGADWRLIRVAASYGEFADRVPGNDVDPARLLAAAERLSGMPVDLVTVDMPLSHDPIVARRVADNAVSRAFGRYQCGTHSPSAERPGPIADQLREGFAAAGYPLLTRAATAPGLAEVYPHPALVVLAQASTRLPYKAARARAYWPGCDRAECGARLRAQWASIVALLDARIAGVAEALPVPPPEMRGRALKAFEDRLDAIVCAWIEIEMLAGRARPYGDDRAAIWAPSFAARNE